jgi:hypothetical protein
MTAPSKLVARDAFITRVTRYINHFFAMISLEDLSMELEEHGFGQ